jgi:hypothetical protein
MIKDASAVSGAKLRPDAPETMAPEKREQFSERSAS